MSLNPGEIRIVPKEKIGVMTMSTHGIPISVLIGYLERYVENLKRLTAYVELMFISYKAVLQDFHQN